MRLYEKFFKDPRVKKVDLQELFALSPKHKKAYSKYKERFRHCGCSICFLNWCIWKKIELPKEWKDYVLWGC